MLKINGSQCTVHVYTQPDQNMLKYASFGYEKMSKNGPIFGHLKNDQILSNFCDPPKVSKVLLEWSLEISFGLKLNKF